MDSRGGGSGKLRSESKRCDSSCCPKASYSTLSARDEMADKRSGGHGGFEVPGCILEGDGGR